MAVFLSVSTDPFEEVFRDSQQRPTYQNVRRPLRGITVKEDTYAVIRVKTATGKDIQIFDSSSPDVIDGIGRSSSYSNFILQSVQEQRMEKQQIIETFGEDYIFFFGERPRFLNISGLVLNTKDFNWKSEFWTNYDRYLRGTRLVENNARLYLYFDDIVVEGYITSAVTQQSSDDPHRIPFQFQLFVTNYAVLSTVGAVVFQQDTPIAEVGGLPPDGTAAASNAVLPSAAGGLNSFLAASSALSVAGGFSIASTLEAIKTTFYGRNIVVPEGFSANLYVPPISNQASFAPAPTNRPIHEMNDEYVARTPAPANGALDAAELARVSGELALRTPEALEARARALLATYGIDTSRRDPTMMLLGRGAFAGVQYVGAFGIRRVDGVVPDIVNPFV